MDNIVTAYCCDDPEFYGYVEYREGVYYVILANWYKAYPTEADKMVKFLVAKVKEKWEIA